MKQSAIIITIVCALLAGSVSMLYGSEVATAPSVCCKQSCGKEKQPKTVDPVSYFPMGNIF